jgi:hypothetical protein
VSELGSGVGGGELPVDLSLVGVDGVVPRGEFTVEDVQVGDATIQTLAGQGRQFDLGDVEPGPVLAGVVDLQPLCQGERLGFEGLLERADRMGVRLSITRTTVSASG